MKNLTRSFPVKAIAFFLAVLCLLVAAGCTFVAALLVQSGYYLRDARDLRAQVLQDQLLNYTYRVIDESLYDRAAESWPVQDSNLRLRVSIGDTVIEDTYAGEEVCAQVTDTYELYGGFLWGWGLGPQQFENGFFLSADVVEQLQQLPGIRRYAEAGGDPALLFGSGGVELGESNGPERSMSYQIEDDAGDTADGQTAPDRLTTDSGDAPDDESDESDESTDSGWPDMEDIPGGLGAGIWYPLDGFEEPLVTVQLWLVEPLAADDVFQQTGRLVMAAAGLRDWLVPLAVIGWLVGLVCVVFLFAAAGHRAGCEGVVPNPLDRVPLDVYLAACIGLGVLLFLGIFLCLEDISAITLVLALLCVIALGVLVLGALLSLATRMKLGHMLQNTLCWRILAPCFRALGRCWRLLVHALGGIPLVWKTALGLGAALFLDFLISVCIWDASERLGFWLVRSAALAVLVLLVALNLRTLQKGIRRMADGDLDSRVDTRYLLGDFRRCGEDLGRIREGMAHAVDERLKSERLKTELITNVSHDIKTPLTSIINYVDLIKKQQPEDETLRQYIEVLDRQSGRLKKLIGDLIEASKASSGALANHAEPCELEVLLAQVSGEYSEKLTAAGLTPVINTPPEPVRILADGRHMWRVFDNLMNNICKYAQSGTRVYIDLQQQDGQATVIFRNISREALHVSGEELMERFVRGDRSRHTEGSGLGLSIARSLTELQHGTLDLNVDGDLFKVTLRFPLSADAPALPPKASAPTAASPAGGRHKSAAAPAARAPASDRHKGSAEPVSMTPTNGRPTADAEPATETPAADTPAETAGQPPQNPADGTPQT